jgi:hypothetical protein
VVEINTPRTSILLAVKGIHAARPYTACVDVVVKGIPTARLNSREGKVIHSARP